MTIQEYLDQLIAVEQEVGALYATFARRFHQREDASEFWQGMAADEAEHAALLTDIRPQLTPETAAVELSEDPAHLATALAELARLQEIARDGDVSIQAAMALAFGIEYSLAEKHVQVQSLAESPPWREMFERLHQADDEHIQRLREHAARYGIHLPEDV
ncbi:MAG: hypothetical protein JXQ27_10860 [Acidobacteria bacterium]|nr:hypothetical protein [Acidobacteriota bacterium]